MVIDKFQFIQQRITSSLRFDSSFFFSFSIVVSLLFRCGSILFFPSIFRWTIFIVKGGAVKETTTTTFSALNKYLFTFGLPGNCWWRMFSHFTKLGTTKFPLQFFCFTLNETEEINGREFGSFDLM